MNEKQKARFKRLASRNGMIEPPNWLDKTLEQWDGEFWTGLHRGAWECKKQADLHWKRWRGHRDDLDKLQARPKPADEETRRKYAQQEFEAKILLMAEHSSAITYESASARLERLAAEGEAVDAPQNILFEASGLLIGSCAFTFSETPRVNIGSLRYMTPDAFVALLSPEAADEVAALIGAGTMQNAA